MAKPCGSMACTALDGKIYAVGGGFQRTYYDTADAYDPGSDTWIPLTCMNSLRFSTAGTALNGALYCCGGYDGTAYLDTVERFDPREGRWQRVASMCTGRGALSVVASHGCVWVLGGYNAIEHGFLTSVEKYDPRMDKWGWATMESLPQPRAYGTAFALGNAIYVNGGMQEPGKNLGLARFNVEENVWEEMTAASCPNRSMMAAVVVSNL
jgi:N-acetylneuraminic acid mutarotase